MSSGEELPNQKEEYARRPVGSGGRRRASKTKPNKPNPTKKRRRLYKLRK